MLIRFKFILSFLTIVLIALLNFLFLCIIDLGITYIHNNFKISINKTMLLIIIACSVSIISYYIINKISSYRNTSDKKNNIEIELNNALRNVKYSNQELQLEIAERKKIEKALIESENQIRGIIQKAPTGIALLDKEGWILECNPALQNMLGYDEDELSGVLFFQAIHPQDIPLYKNNFQELVNGTSDIYKINTRYIHREFREVWGSLSASIVRDAENQPEFVIAMVEDITTKQQAEEKILNYQRQLQSLTSELSLIEERERRRIATNLHDHVGQVLTLVGIKIDELHEKLSPTICDPLLQEIRGLVGQTIKCIRSLMFDLSPPILYDLGLEDAIEWLAEHFSQEHDLKIQVSKDEQPKALKTEGNIILFQSVKELLSNIVKHSQANFVKIFIQRACNDLRIIVEDNGIGFDINLIDHKQHKIKGYGLFTIYERLEYYGGRMIIESNTSQGTKITLLMPMVSTKSEGWCDVMTKYKVSNHNRQLTTI